MCIRYSRPKYFRIPIVIGSTSERFDFLLVRLFVLLHTPKDKDTDDLGPSVRLDPPLLLLLLGILQGEAVAGEGLEHLEVRLANLERKRCTPGQMINTRTRWSTQHLERWSTQGQDDVGLSNINRPCRLPGLSYQNDQIMLMDKLLATIDLGMTTMIMIGMIRWCSQPAPHSKGCRRRWRRLARSPPWTRSRPPGTCSGGCPRRPRVVYHYYYYYCALRDLVRFNMLIMTLWGWWWWAGGGEGCGWN